MTTNHIDQLAQWWRDAEEGIGKAGDVVIERDDSPNFGAPSYVVFMLGRDEYENLTYRRILSRAPKPKPAWHDALAVMAALDVNSYDGWSDGYWPERRELWVRDGEAWESVAGGITVPPERLIDPVPLVEAKVTDKMVKRAAQSLEDAGWDTSDGNAALTDALTAALGLETA